MSEKKVKQYADKYKLPIVKIMVRGGTDHRKDLCLEGGDIIELYPDGTMEKGEMKWHVK